VSRRILVFTPRTDPRSTEQVETLLKSQDSTDSSKDAPHQGAASAYVASTINQSLPNGDFSTTAGSTQARTGVAGAPGDGPFQDVVRNKNTAEQDCSWEMIGLGLEEPLPPQEVMDDL
jgi:hypothetical protein